MSTEKEREALKSIEATMSGVEWPEDWREEFQTILAALDELDFLREKAKQHERHEVLALPTSYGRCPARGGSYPHQTILTARGSVECAYCHAMVVGDDS